MKVTVKIPKRSKEECSHDCIFNYDCGYACLLYGGSPGYFNEDIETELWKRYDMKAVPKCQEEWERQNES